MSQYTEKLGLFKYDKEIDGESKFSLSKALNENWDKIDAFAKTNQYVVKDVTNYIEDEETIIGFYKGKPLYRKIGTLTTLSSVGVKNYDITDLNIENIFNLSGVMLGVTTYEGTVIPNASPLQSGQFGIWASPTSITVRTTADIMVDREIRYYIEYTKTTDTEVTVPIGKPSDYSLEERIVGTWFDGRPVYQKTFFTHTPDKTGFTPLDWLDVKSLNIEYALSIEGMMCPKNTHAVPANQYLNETNNSALWIDLPNHGGLAMNFTLEAHKNIPLIITLKYIKFTD